MILGYFEVTEAISGVKNKFRVDNQNGRRRPCSISKKKRQNFELIYCVFYHQNIIQWQYFQLR